MSTAKTEWKLGKLAGQEISATPAAIVGGAVLWAVLSAIAYWGLKLPIGTAILGGLAATALHFFSELWHQLSHAFSARRTGHPMSGIRFGFLGVLSSGLYPPDEGELPPAVHIRRALGGPIGSFVLSIVAAILFLAVNSIRSGGTLWWLSLFLLLENFFVFTLEVFVPLGFNDASTILHWSRVRRDH